MDNERDDSPPLVTSDLMDDRGRGRPAKRARWGSDSETETETGSETETEHYMGVRPPGDGPAIKALKTAVRRALRATTTTTPTDTTPDVLKTTTLDVKTDTTPTDTPTDTTDTPSTLDPDAAFAEADFVDLRAVDDDDDAGVAPDLLPHNTHAVVELPVSTLASPQSVAVNYEPALAVVDEGAAVDALLELVELARPSSSRDYTYIDLEDFEIYMRSKDTGARLRALHFLGAGKNSHNVMYVDGVLRVGDATRHVQGVPFAFAPVDHYGVRHVTVRGHVSIHSLRHSTRGTPVYYRLTTPSPVYARFWWPYLWVADLAKHVADYVDAQTTRDAQDVRLAHFRAHFDAWLQRRHGKNAQVQAWRAQYRPGPQADFRPAVVAYRDYLQREARAVLGTAFADGLGVFRETRATFYPVHELRPSSKIAPTVVTPYMHHVFGRLAVGKYMRPVRGRNAMDALDGRVVLPQARTAFVTGPDRTLSLAEQIRRLRPGDVLSTRPDGEDTGSKWSAADRYWYAVVHRVHDASDLSDTLFDVAWLYAPQHTPCRAMHYPWPTELFLSDHCTCTTPDDTAVAARDVVGVHSVAWFGGPDSAADFFVRQTYLAADRCWVQLELGHVFCHVSAREARATPWFAQHASADVRIGEFTAPAVYARGDTVLAVLGERAEPCIVEDIVDVDDDVTLRVLTRRCEADDARAPPNELVYTDVLVRLAARFIVAPCTVRVLRAGAPVPTPYDRGGTGNLFYLTHRWDGRASAPFGDTTAFRQGFDPHAPVPRLRALELFCGCGNLGRGLEDAGATETRAANDIWPAAMHTFMANVAAPAAVAPFIGSADTLLRCAITGVATKGETRIPQPGEIDLVSGGSPCQGFSTLTPDRTTPQQFKNRSMVASFASFVDVYRPKHGLLENVAAMVGAKVSSRAHDEDVFGQLVCALLGLGYQLRIVLGNAWAHGAPQLRQRVFVVFAAPGQRLPDAPYPSHGAPDASVAATAGHRRQIGRLVTGEWISAPAPAVCAFAPVTCGVACADLEALGIDDGLVDICIAQPDHRVALGVTDHMRLKIAQIPTQPYGLGLAEVRHTPSFAHVAHLFTPNAIARPVTRAYKRNDPRHLFRTVRTACVVADARSSGALHWQQPRPLTVLEARRAQGMPDTDLLLANTPAEAWKMVGNAVARPMALALGLALRRAWLGSLYAPLARPKPDARPEPDAPEPELATPRKRIFTSPSATPATTVSLGRRRDHPDSDDSDSDTVNGQDRSNSRALAI